MLSSFVLSATLLSSVLAQTSPFDPREATISSIHTALYTGQSSCRSIISSFIARIETFNPLINAVISLNPSALDDADRLDMSLASGNATSSLFCIPILLKDNYDAVSMPTTGGAVVLNSSFPTADAPTVTAFRNAGAIFLGKTNLHEFALEGLSLSSLGGQTLNPYDLTRTPGGSSGGTGAAIAASFAVLGTGSDTVNSLRSPASANSLYSFRPTYGLISRTGVIPVSWTQDTIGAMGRNLYDIASTLTVMASVGYDIRDNATARVPSGVKEKDYVSAVTQSSNLRGIRIGVLRDFFNYTSTNETDPVNALMDMAISSLVEAGAEIIDINDASAYNATSILAQLDVQQFEYREGLTSYLKSNLTGPRPVSMPELYLSNRNTPSFLVIPAQYSYIQNALRSSTSNSTYADRLRGITNLTITLHSTFSNSQLDAIIYPEQKNLVVPIGSPSQSGRNGILAALTGSPVITMPIGFSNASTTAPVGIPIGMEILGLPWTEHKLLSIAKALDDRLHARKPPITDGLDSDVEVTHQYTQMPVIKPQGPANIEMMAYPLGEFGI